MDTPKTPTLSDRVRALFDKISIKTPLFISERHFCIICGLPRFDLDVTGITCGSERCYRELGEKLREFENDSAFLRKVANKVDLIELDGGIDFDKLEDEITTRVKMAETMMEIANELGLDSSKDMETLCDDVLDEIEDVQSTIKEIEKSQSKKTG